MRHFMFAILALAATPDHGCDPWGRQMDPNVAQQDKPCRTVGEVPWGCVVRSQADCTQQRLIPVCAETTTDAQKRAVPSIGIGFYLVGCAPFDPNNPPVWWTPQSDCGPIDACGVGAVDTPCISDSDCASCLCDTVVGVCTG
jgi:hypothetical protein